MNNSTTSSPQDISSLILSTLTNAKYKNIARTRQDVHEVLNHYPGLAPVPDNFVYSDGSAELLLKLTGTLPVNYKGSIYYIPIDLWLLNTYPYNAPIIFITPTPNMMIRVSKNVMVDGKVNLDYLRDWKHGSSDLIALTQVLISFFEAGEPPVYYLKNSSHQPPPIPFSMPYGVPFQNFTHSQQSPSEFHYSSPQISQQNSYPLTEERIDLLSTATEKIIRQLQTRFTSTCIEYKNSETLKEGSERLARMLEKIKEEEDRCSAELKILNETNNELTAKIITHESEVEERGIKIDEAISTQLPLHRQILETYTEEAAIQDGIYFVSEGFRLGKMELDQFEKNIRKLARKQFMLRLLLIKCRQKAGLS